MTANFYITSPLSGMPEKEQKVYLISTNDGRFMCAFGGYIDSQKADDWRDKVPTEAHVYRQADEKSTSPMPYVQSDLIVGPYEQRNEKGDRQTMLPWARALVLPADFDPKEVFKIRIFYRGTLLDEILYLRFVKPPYVVNPSTPTNPNTTSFITYGGFGPSDTTMYRVDLMQGTDFERSGQNLYVNPMGYWAATINGATAGPNHYILGWVTQVPGVREHSQYDCAVVQLRYSRGCECSSGNCLVEYF